MRDAPVERSFEEPLEGVLPFLKIDLIGAPVGNR